MTITYYEKVKSASQRSRRLEARYPSALWGTDRDKDGYFVTCQTTPATLSGLETHQDVEGVKFLNEKSQVEQIMEQKIPDPQDLPTRPAKQPRTKIVSQTGEDKTPRLIRVGTKAAQVLDVLTSTEGDFDAKADALVTKGIFDNASLARDWARYVIARAGLPIEITKRKGGRQAKAA